MQSQSRLEKLPPEVLPLILGYLSYHSLLRLRLVSKFLSGYATALVFSDLSLDINHFDEDGFHRNLWLVKHLATGSSLISSAVQTLHIESLYSPRYQRLTGGGRLLRDDDVGPDEGLVRATLSEHLDQFLSNLQNLETVFWTHDAKRDPACYLGSVAQNLASLPKLKNLNIRIKLTSASVPEPDLPPLHPFGRLSGVSISSNHNLPVAYWEGEVHTVVKTSVELGSFSLILDNGHKTPQPCVQTIIGETPRSNLERLVLQNVALPPPGLHSFCTQRLKHLALSTSLGPRAPAVAWSSVWTGLQDLGVELLSLSVPVYGEGVDDMFNYLLSYSALQELKITRVHMGTQLAEDAAGNTFWHAVVPKHKGSLIDLAVSPVYEGSWCYGQATASAIRQCPSLKRLSLRLNPTDDSWLTDEIVRLREDSDVKFPEQDHDTLESATCYLALLILHDTRIEAIPLEKLVVDVAKPATMRETDMAHLQRGTRSKGSRDEYQLRSQMRSVLDQVKAGLCSFRLPQYAGRDWPTVEIGNGRALCWKENVAQERPSSTLLRPKYGSYTPVSA